MLVVIANAPGAQFVAIVYIDNVSVAPPGEYVGNLWLLGVQNGPHVDTANAKRHRAHYEKTWRHPQNGKYIIYHTVVRRRPSHRPV